MREAFERRPEAHRHQLIALARGAPPFELARAGWLDRCANRAAVGAAVHERALVEAATIEHAHAVAAAGPHDWPQALAAGAEAGARVAAAGAAAADAHLRHRLAELEQALGGPPPGPPPVPAPELRLRTPWAPPEPLPGLPVRLDAGAWEAALEPAPAAAGTGDAAAPYRALRDSLTGGDRASVALREAAGAIGGSPTPAQLAAVIAAPLRVRAEDALERQAAWPDALVAGHWRALLDALEEAATPTEVELAAAHSDACFAVEADWNTLLHAALLLPLRAVLRGADPAPAVAAAHERSGLGPRAILGLPRVAAIAERVARDPQVTTAEPGEPGFDLLRDARDRAAATGEPLPGVERLRALLDEAGAPEPPPRPRTMTLWGEPVDLRADPAEAPPIARPAAAL